MNLSIESKFKEIMESSNEKIFNCDQELLEFIQLSYLKNLQYDDEDIDVIRYTIRTIFNITTNFELSSLVAGIIYYGISGMNVLFENNNEIVMVLI